MTHDQRIERFSLKYIAIGFCLMFIGMIFSVLIFIDIGTILLILSFILLCLTFTQYDFYRSGRA